MSQVLEEVGNQKQRAEMVSGVLFSPPFIIVISLMFYRAVLYAKFSAFGQCISSKYLQISKWALEKFVLLLVVLAFLVPSFTWKSIGWDLMICCPSFGSFSLVTIQDQEEAFHCVLKQLFSLGTFDSVSSVQRTSRWDATTTDQFVTACVNLLLALSVLLVAPSRTKSRSHKWCVLPILGVDCHTAHSFSSFYLAVVLLAVSTSHFLQWEQ